MWFRHTSVSFQVTRTRTVRGVFKASTVQLNNIYLRHAFYFPAKRQVFHPLLSRSSVALSASIIFLNSYRLVLAYILVYTAATARARNRASSIFVFLFFPFSTVNLYISFLFSSLPFFPSSRLVILQSTSTSTTPILLQLQLQARSMNRRLKGRERERERMFQTDRQTGKQMNVCFP